MKNILPLLTDENVPQHVENPKGVPLGNHGFNHHLPLSSANLLSPITREPEKNDGWKTCVKVLSSIASEERVSGVINWIPLIAAL